MDKAIVNFSFDDGRGDNWRLFQTVLKPLAIPATFNIATGYIEGCRCGIRDDDTAGERLSIEKIQQMAECELVEIACHGDMHRNDEADIAAGRAKLLDWLGLAAETPLGFASPGSGISPAYVREHEIRLKSLGLLYVRTSSNIASFRSLRVICRKASRVLHNGLLYRTAYQETMQGRAQGLLVTSVPVVHDTTLRELRALIGEAERRRAMLTLMFHSVLKPGEHFYDNPWSYDYDRFRVLCDYLLREQATERLMLCTTADAHRRLLEENSNV